MKRNCLKGNIKEKSMSDSRKEEGSDNIEVNIINLQIKEAQRLPRTLKKTPPMAYQLQASQRTVEKILPSTSVSCSVKNSLKD